MSQMWRIIARQEVWHTHTPILQRTRTSTSHCFTVVIEVKYTPIGFCSRVSFPPCLCVNALCVEAGKGEISSHTVLKNWPSGQQRKSSTDGIRLGLTDINQCTSTHLEEGNDERPQREVGGLMKLWVKLFDGESGVLPEGMDTGETNFRHTLSFTDQQKSPNKITFFILFAQGLYLLRVR